MKAIELNHCRWQFSAICLVVVVVGGGHFNRRRRRRRHNKLQRSPTHGRAAQRSDARACCCSGCAALSHFAFHILTQRKAARLCPPPRAAFAVDFQCEMKSRGWWTCVRFHGSTVPPQCISISSLQSSSASTDTCGTSKKTFADISEQKM